VREATGDTEVPKGLELQRWPLRAFVLVLTEFQRALAAEQLYDRLRHEARCIRRILRRAMVHDSMTGILLVHGAWHGPWCWDNFAERLREYGHDVRVIGLRGHDRPTGPIWNRDGTRYRCTRY